MHLTLDLWKVATFLKEMLDRLLPIEEDALTDALHSVHVLIIFTLQFVIYLFTYFVERQVLHML